MERGRRREGGREREMDWVVRGRWESESERVREREREREREGCTIRHLQSLFTSHRSQQMSLYKLRERESDRAYNQQPTLY